MVVVLVVLLAEKKVARKEYWKDNEMAYMKVDQKACRWVAWMEVLEVAAKVVGLDVLRGGG